jgi:putative SOS response-associated peptidase YedK
MCGRYRLSWRTTIIEEYFDTAPWDHVWSPRYNIAPTQPIPVVRQHRKEPVRQISLMKWGLIPNWAKNPSIATGRSMRNRDEDPLKFRRCLITADGFYEWRCTRTGKQPYCFEVSGGELFAFAGLWDGWKTTDGQWIKTCSILTTTPNAVTSAIHDRMPVILDRESFDLWFDPGMTSVEVVSELLKPYGAKAMRCYPLNTRINHVANDDEECWRAIEVKDVQNRLFEEAL